MRQARFCIQCGAALVEREVHDRLRPVCSQCQQVHYFDPKVAVVAFLVQAEQVLLVQRRYDPGQGKWALPAGFVEWDEDPAQAAIRETYEETGLAVEIAGLLDVFPRRDQGMADIVIAYAVRQIGGQLLAGDDAVAAAWFGPQELPELVFYPSQTLVTRWKQGLL